MKTGRENRAIAGLSMGGSQTLNIAIPNLNDYAYVGVFSSGVLGGGGRGRGAAPAATPAPPFGEAWEKRHLAMLDDAAAKKGLKVFWLSTGKDDFLIETSRSTVKLLERHGFTPKYIESEGGHTWLNWRDTCRSSRRCCFSDRRGPRLRAWPLLLYLSHHSTFRQREDAAQTGDLFAAIQLVAGARNEHFSSSSVQPAEFAWDTFQSGHHIEPAAISESAPIARSTAG